MFRVTIIAIVVVMLVGICRAHYGNVLLSEEFKSVLGRETPHHRHRRDTCGGTYTHETVQKVVTSPNYPHDYHNSMTCFYTIEVPRGHYIEIRFLDFRIEIPRTSSSNCTYDGLVVHDGSAAGEPMGRYCGKVKPPDFMSRTNVVLLQLYSDESLGFRGFKLTYTVHCGATFFTEHGTLLFAEMHDHVTPTNSCDYELVATPNHYLDLNFTINSLSVTDVFLYDRGQQVRSLIKTNVYNNMEVRMVSISNVVRIRFVFSGHGEGNAIIAYQAHRSQLLSDYPIFLFHPQTCKGLRATVTDVQNGGSAVVSNTTKDAVLHRIERVGGHMNDTINAGDEVYIRTMQNANRPLSLAAVRDGSLVYDGTAHDNAIWRMFGELRHGGRVWFENKQLPGQYVGVHGTVAPPGSSPRVQLNAGLCAAAVEWTVYKMPLDFGWDKFATDGNGAYEARWVDGLPVAAYSNCLLHPLVFPYCAGKPQQQCSVQ